MTGTYEGFGGRVGRTFAGSEGWWPPRPEVAAGCAERRRRARRRPRLLRPRLLRLGDRHAEPRRARRRRPALHQLPRHADVLADAGRAADRPEPAPGRARHRRPLATPASPATRWSSPTTSRPPPRCSATRATRRSWSASGTSRRTPTARPPGRRTPGRCQRGFDRFYGFLDAFTNLHHPHRLVEDNHLVEVDRYPDGYYFTDDITDRAIAMVREQKASNPRKPFFLYLAHGAVHAPLARQGRRHRPVRGPVRRRAGTRCASSGRAASRSSASSRKGCRCRRATTSPATTSQPGTSSPTREQQLFARHMEVYAGMVDNIDQNVGRLRRRARRARASSTTRSSCSRPTTARRARAR